MNQVTRSLSGIIRQEKSMANRKLKLYHFEISDKLFTYKGGIPDDPDPCLSKSLHFFFGCPFSARDNRARMAHPSARRSCQTSDKSHHRLLHILFNILG